MGEARTLTEHYVKVWNDHDATGWLDSFGADAELVAPGGVSGSGAEMVNMFYALWQDAFPDNQVRVVTIVEEGDMSVLEAVFEGTHTGTLNAPGQSIPATGKRVSVPFVNVSKIDGGKLANFALYFDQAELLGQLGLMPAAG